MLEHKKIAIIGLGSEPPAAEITPGEATVFLGQASFGATSSDIAAQSVEHPHRDCFFPASNQQLVRSEKHAWPSFYLK